jgi:hypothetical protein
MQEKKQPLLGNGSVDASIPRQWLCKHIIPEQSLCNGHHATMEELLEATFSVWSMPRQYNSDPLAMKNSCEMDASQRGRKPLNMKAEQPLPRSAQ